MVNQRTGYFSPESQQDPMMENGKYPDSVKNLSAHLDSHLTLKSHLFLKKLPGWFTEN